MTTLHRPTFVALALALIFAFAVSGCNTTRGVGQDVERAGEVIQDTAR